MAKIGKIFSFSLDEYMILFKSWYLFLKWDVLISCFNHKKWQHHVVNPEDSPSNSNTLISDQNTSQPSYSTQIKKIIFINEIAGRNHYKHMNCLRRCLCQKELLNGFNIKSKLHIGVKFVDKKLAAHSWLSSNDCIINDSYEVISTYKELKTLDDASTLSLFK